MGEHASKQKNLSAYTGTKGTVNISFTLNGKPVVLKTKDVTTPLLWILRDELGLKGTKYGCGIGRCGACSVHLNGRLARACSIPISDTAGHAVNTIEGLSDSSRDLHPLQKAWVQHDVPQCGYCQAGQLMAASALLSSNPTPTDEEIDTHMVNICRCGTYLRIKAAIKSVASAKALQVEELRQMQLVKRHTLIEERDQPQNDMQETNH
ncbi:(2Fe-2S)-binding protein [Thalassotalea euphylliae]|uniref:(2Fe-2S)-binding protein n=1 Tax=Thalassotalea euphylliae TaxID=1655234 RepID=UPI003631558E